MDQSIVFLIQDFAVVLVAAALASTLCKRMHLSPIVGYLLAGIAVGTPQITFVYVTDAARVGLLSQLGLIFLMFSIGLGFRLQRFKELGWGMIVACGTTALLMLTLTRLAAGWLGYGQGPALFLAAMVMVSSSAVIGKSLQGQGLTHRRFGQLALGITLCEDIVAIILLAFLGSYAAMEPQSSGSMGDALGQVGALLAFAVLLIVPGLIFVPRMLKKVSLLKHDSSELQTVIVAALLFTMAFITLRSGYSLALGSFLCGVIVAETSQSKSVSESFGGLRDVFVAVFFVSIGMAVDVTRFPEALGLIAFGTVAALVLRPLAAHFGLLVACEDPKDAVKAGLCLTPIGEFTFVIANLGVAAGILDERYQVAAVGIAFLTAVLSPWVMQRCEAVATVVNVDRLPTLGKVARLYRDLLRLIGRQQDSSLIWRLLRPRIPQVAGELLFVSAILVFSGPVFVALQPRFESMEPALREAYRIGYWLVVAALVIVPLVALVRNINAIAMMIGEYVTMGMRSAPALRRALMLLVRTLALVSLGLWVLNVAPFSWLSGYTLAAVSAVVGLALIFGWRTMVRLHSEAAFSLGEAVGRDEPAEAEARALRQARLDWGIELEEWTLGSIDHAGRSIGEMQLRRRSGATIVGIERQGHYLPSIGPETHLFSGDRLYASGSPEQLDALRLALEEASREEVESTPNYSSAILETGVVGEGSACAGHSLRSLRWPRVHGVQVVAMRRGDAAPRSPEIDEPLEVGDALLLVGAPRSLALGVAQLESPAVGGG